jgi:hypothetical protein
MSKSERDVNAVTNTLLSGLEQPTKQESPGSSHGEAQTLRKALTWLAIMALNHDDVPCPPYIANCPGYWGGGHGQCVQCLVDWALVEAQEEAVGDEDAPAA